MIGYFVTGTDTSVGKTYVTCTLARRARLHGQKVFAFKPIESGCERRPDGTYVGADQELLVESAGAWQLGPLRGLYQLPLPAAPLVAAEAAGTAIDLDLIVGVASQAIQREQPGLTLVEGAGGWRVPITRDADTSTLARALGLPLVVVARAGLGTINHTLLTVEAIERDGLPVAAVVFSQRRDDDQRAALRNRDEVLRRWPGTLLVLGEDPAAVDSLVTPPSIIDA
jgi:dethiobiotin synthetase